MGHQQSIEGVYFHEQLQEKGIKRMDPEIQRRLARGGVVYNMKVVVRGDAATGKSTLTRIMEGGTFSREYKPTSRIETATVNWNYKATDDVVKVEVWDVADGASSSAAAPANLDVYHGANAVVVMVDPTKRGTFEYAKKTIQSLPERLDVLLLINFKDLDSRRSVPASEVEQFLRTCEANVKCAESSLFSGFGLKQIRTFLNIPFLKLKQAQLELMLSQTREELSMAERELELVLEQDYDTFLRQQESIRQALTHADPVAAAAAAGGKGTDRVGPTRHVRRLSRSRSGEMAEAAHSAAISASKRAAEAAFAAECAQLSAAAKAQAVGIMTSPHGGRSQDKAAQPPPPPPPYPPPPLSPEQKEQQRPASVSQSKESTTGLGGKLKGLLGLGKPSASVPDPQQPRSASGTPISASSQKKSAELQRIQRSQLVEDTGGNLDSIEDFYAGEIEDNFFADEQPRGPTSQRNKSAETKGQAYADDDKDSGNASDDEAHSTSTDVADRVSLPRKSARKSPSLFVPSSTAGKTEWTSGSSLSDSSVARSVAPAPQRRKQGKKDQVTLGGGEMREFPVAEIDEGFWSDDEQSSASGGGTRVRKEKKKQFDQTRGEDPERTEAREEEAESHGSNDAPSAAEVYLGDDELPDMPSFEDRRGLAQAPLPAAGAEVASTTRSEQTQGGKEKTKGRAVALSRGSLFFDDEESAAELQRQQVQQQQQQSEEEQGRETVQASPDNDDGVIVLASDEEANEDQVGTAEAASSSASKAKKKKKSKTKTEDGSEAAESKKKKKKKKKDKGQAAAAE